MDQHSSRVGAAGDEPRGGAVLVAALLVGAAVFALHLAFARSFEVPLPRAHDEFAYLLSADTFAQGRLTNPTHELWPFFETFHVSHHPVYQGKYPPGQSAFLALGQWLGGEPALGVWLALALGCAAMVWMLAGLVPLGWAVGGTLLFAVNFKVLLNWGQSYWGGGAALLGGALFAGGLVRLRRAPSLACGVAMSVGALILANTRPLEGLLATLCAAPVLLVYTRRWEPPRLRGVLTVYLPLALTAVAVVAWTLAYNAALTGDPLTLPHVHWRGQDALDPLVRSYSGSTPRVLPGKLYQLGLTYVGWPLLVALPFAVGRCRRRGVAWAAATVVAIGLVSVLTTRAWPHYLAPLACLTTYLVIESLRGLAGVRVGGRRVGAVAVVVLVVAHAGLSLGGFWSFAVSEPPVEWFRERARLIAELEALPGRDLVVVRYDDDHDIHHEWVYNAADIDAAEVVFARDRGPEENRALLEYFADRRVWRLEPREPEYLLTEYERPPR